MRSWSLEPILTILAVVPIAPDRRTLWLTLATAAAIVGLALWLLLAPRARQQLVTFATEHARGGLVILLVLFCLALLVTLRPKPPPGPLPPTPSLPPAQPGDPWPMDRGTLTRLGAVAHSSGPDRDQVAWTFDRGDEAFHASPAVVGNRVYCVASSNDQGRIVCVDSETGRLVWSAAPTDYRATFSSPIVVDHLLLCGEGLHSTRQARLVAVDLRPGFEGRIRWTFPTNSHIECTPTLVDGKVYFGAGDDGVYCLAIHPPGSPTAPYDQPRLVFHGSGRDYPDAETSLAVHAGRLYLGLGVGGQALCVLDATTGRELKRLPMTLPVFGPPAIAGGKLYVGLGNGDYAQPGSAREGQVACIDLERLEVQWTQSVPGTVLGAIALDQGFAYWACGDGRIYRRSLDDGTLDSFDTGSPIGGSVALSNSSVYAVNESGRLVALDRATLRPRFEHHFARRFGGTSYYISSPTVFGHRLVVGTPADGLVCLGPDAAVQMP